MGQFSMQEMAIFGSNFGANQQSGNSLECRATASRRARTIGDSDSSRPDVTDELPDRVIC
jgi:hypothetical protein